jgi:putative transposase
MPYCRLYYHLVWATHGREPLLTSEIETEAHSAIRLKARALGSNVFAVSGIEDHVHFVGTVPANTSVAKFIGELKGSSSFHVNHLPNKDCLLVWQRGYGALSLAHKDLQRVIDYVEGQKTHHAESKLWPSLEECSEQDGVPPSMVREVGAEYDPFVSDGETDILLSDSFEEGCHGADVKASG